MKHMIECRKEAREFVSNARRRLSRLVKTGALSGEDVEALKFIVDGVLLNDVTKGVVVSELAHRIFENSIDE